MASGPITSWEIDGEKYKQTMKKVMTKLDSILKSREITLLTKVCLFKAMVFPVVMYEGERWTIKKTEHKGLMRLNCSVGADSWDSIGLQGDQTSPTQRKSTLNIHWKDWWWKLKLQSFGRLMRRAKSLEKSLMLGKTEGKRRGWQRMRWSANITNSMGMNLSWLWETVKDREPWQASVHGVVKSQTWLSDWTATIMI